MKNFSQATIFESSADVSQQPNEDSSHDIIHQRSDLSQISDLSHDLNSYASVYHSSDHLKLSPPTNRKRKISIVAAPSDHKVYRKRKLSFFSDEKSKISVFQSTISFFKSHASLVSSHFRLKKISSTDVEGIEVEEEEDDDEELTDLSEPRMGLTNAKRPRRVKVDIETFRNTLKSYPRFIPKSQFEKMTENTNESNADVYWYNDVDYCLYTLLTISSSAQLILNPIRIANHGVLPFSIAYGTMICLVGYPMMLLEAGLGQCVSRGPGGCWKFAKLFKGVGLVQIFRCVIMSARLIAVLQVMVAYGWQYFNVGYPWEPGNEIHYKYVFGGLPVHSAIETVKNKKMPNLTISTTTTQKPATSSPGKTSIWEDNTSTYVTFIVNWILAMFFLLPNIQIRGRIGSVVYVCIFLCLCVICIIGLSLPGAMQGVQFAFQYRPIRNLLHLNIWVETCERFIMVLILTPGFHMTLASYNHFNNHIVFDMMFIVLMDCLLNLIGILIMFSLLGYLNETIGYPLEESFKTKGIQFLLIYLPYALSTAATGLPLFALYVGLFTILWHGNLIGFLEVVVTGFIDLFNLNKHKRPLVVILVCAFGMISSVWCCTKIKWIMVVVIEQYLLTVPPSMNFILMLIAIAWVYGVNQFIALIECAEGWYTTVILSHPRSKIWWALCWKYVSPLLFVFIIVLKILVRFSGKKDYDLEKRFPFVSKIGLGMWVIDGLLVLGTMVVLLAKAKGSFKTRLQHLTTPTSDWGPALPQNRFIMNIGEQDRLKEKEARKKPTFKLPTQFKDLRY